MGKELVGNDFEERKCSICGKPMNRGYCVDDGALYYCSEECLKQRYTWADYLELYDAGAAYWTEWESD